MTICNIPSRVFIIPYRDRVNDKKIFIENMTTILDDETKKIHMNFIFHTNMTLVHLIAEQ